MNFTQDSNIGKPLEEFIKIVQIGPRAILEEYRKVQGLDKDEASPTGDQNNELNRWGDIKCFESTRVILTPPREYIHANYVDGFRHPRKFICTQGPLRKTINDFWRMVWQEKTVIIVALTKVGGAKCELYFPHEKGTAIQAGSIKIQNQQVEHIRDTYDKSTLQISKEGQKRSVVHLLYHAWPDKGTPESSSEYITFMEHFNELQRIFTVRLQQENQWIDSKGPPIVVHCSAGVGRTGTLCALDVITERMEETKRGDRGPLVSIGQTVAIMRKQRHKAVQRPEQYLFLYLAVVEYALKHDMIDPKIVDVTPFIQRTQS